MWKLKLKTPTLAKKTKYLGINLAKYEQDPRLKATNADERNKESK